jgi:magnesium transporter
MKEPSEITSAPDPTMRAEIKALLPEVVERAPREAVKMLASYPDEFVAGMLTLLNSRKAQRVLDCFPLERRRNILAAASAPVRQQWTRNEAYSKDSVGHMMEPPLAVFRPEITVAEAVAELRLLTARAFITYAFVVDEEQRLVGVVAMREMLLARPDQSLGDIMIREPFRLEPRMELVEAMRATMVRHYPVYPVCETDGKLVGVIRGQMLFEARSVELSLQPGTMVGIEKEERLATPWPRSFRFRHWWLQANLLLAFIAAGVVSFFQDTIDRVLALAVFLPVVISQSSNTGVQTLAVALRGMTLGELRRGREGALVFKETFLGLLNGVATGLTAAVAMYLFATMQNMPDALRLAFVVFIAMVGSCLISGVFGAIVPLVLRKFGTDPATASSIILTTITDVASLGVFLGLATWLI